MLLKAEDGTRRIVELAELKNEVARAAQQADGSANNDNREQGRKR